MDAAVTALTPVNEAALLAEATPDTPRGPMARLQALPARKKVTLGVGVAALLALMVAMALWSHRTPMAPLYPGAVPDTELGPTLDYLRKAGIGYQTSPRGGLIMVPEDKVEELRMQLRIQGIPKAAPNGSEMLDKPSFGDSSLKERAKFMMDLAVKVERQILMITPVQAVKVNVALPQQTDLIRRQAEPSASITVTLHPGRTLDRSQVAAITNIAAGTVPGLQAKNVTLMDQEGNWLTQPDSELRSDAIAQQRLQLRETEARLLKRVNEILEPALGADNLRATVTAELDFNQIESTSEAYSKNQGADAKAAIRSTQSLEAAGVAQPQPTGVPGAASNQAPTPASAPATGASVPPLQAAQAGLTGTGARRENRTNYELDKTVEVKRQATGEVRRINVAVLVNHRSTPDAKTGKPVSAPLSAEEMDKLTSLVQEAVGYKKDRGDSVRVVNIPFRAEPKGEPEVLPVWKAPWLIDLLKAGGMPAAMTLVALMLLLGVVRPALRPDPPPPEPEAPAQLDAVVDDAQALPGPDAAEQLALENQFVESKLTDARELAKSNPVAVANILRSWMDGEPAKA